MLSDVEVEILALISIWHTQVTGTQSSIRSLVARPFQHCLFSLFHWLEEVLIDCPLSVNSLGSMQFDEINSLIDKK